MSQITVKEVVTSRDFNRFIKFGNLLYADCSYYVPDLESELKKTFEPKHNPALAYSDMKLFIAENEGGDMVGRVCAFINHHTNEHWKTKNARFQYFDFVDNPEVSAALLQAVEDWARSMGMNSVEGPMGFTDYDKEGMLVDDFDLMGTMNTYYNYDYYPRHMERLGYSKAADWLQIRVEVPPTLPERYARTAKLVRQHFHLDVRTMTRHEVRYEGWGHKVFDLLNEAFSPLFGFTKFDDKQIDLFVNEYLSLVDLNLVPVVINRKGELIGVAVCLVSLAEALRKTDGHLLPFGWWHLLKAMKWKHADTVELLLIGVRPDYQGMGVNALFFEELVPKFNKMGLKWAETGPQLENNNKELSQWKALNPKLVKRRRCYIKSL